MVRAKFPTLKADKVELVLSGNEFFEKVLQLIEGAKEVIHLQTYIFSFDETGKKIASHLTAAAKRGVKVYLVVDGYGSKKLPPGFNEELKLAGIQFRFFSPFLSSENVSIMRRMHHKILVVDKTISLVGGINLGDKYHGTATDIPWLDFAVLIQGNCNQYLHELCEGIYHKRKPRYNHSPQTGNISIHYRINDWYRRRNEIYKSYKRHVLNSQDSITLFASYFLPGYLFLRRLKMAARKGVKIRIVVGSGSDIALFHHAEKYLYRYLLKNGIEIYEWPESVMHGKLAVFDQQISSIGSYNLNNLSKYQCIELNAEIDNPAFSKTVSEKLDILIYKKCKKISSQKKLGFFSWLKSAFAYYSYKLLMYLIVPLD